MDSIQDVSDISNQVQVASKSSILSHKVDFVSIHSEPNLNLRAFQAKYEVLKPDPAYANEKHSLNGNINLSSKINNGSVVPRFNGSHKSALLVNGITGTQSHIEPGPPPPRVTIHEAANVKLDWSEQKRIGCGLMNLGNSCFMNSVLQCLTYCPPLVNFLLKSNHLSQCKIAGFCMLCEMYKHVQMALSSPGQAIRPITIFHRLRTISKQFCPGRQEDAHEFLRYVVDLMAKNCVTNYEFNRNQKGYDGAKLDARSKETTMINHIFGGYMRSQVICLICKEKSNTFDYFMDFILDIKNINSLERALDRFFQPETLANDNAYKCAKCKRKVPAQKQFTVHQPPNVATFQFKRFDYNRIFGGKISKQVTYPEILNLRPYMSDKKGPPIEYKLIGVLVHLGASCNSGHYFCYVRNSNNAWYQMDDSKVSPVNLQYVMEREAYLLFYVRLNPSPPRCTPDIIKKAIAPNLLLKSSNSLPNGCNIATIRPSLPQSERSNAPLINGTASKSLSISSPKSPSAGLSQVQSSVSPASSQTSSAHLPADKREPISFGIKNQLTLAPNKILTSKTSSGASIMASKPGQKTFALVPYTASSSSDEESTPSHPNSPAHPKVSDKTISETSNGSPSSMPSSSLTNGVSEKTNGLVKSHSIAENGLSPTLTNGTLNSGISPNKFAIKTTPKKCDGTPNVVRATNAKVWHVTENLPHSPSVASASSTNSVNSTTEWSVKEHEERKLLSTSNSNVSLSAASSEISNMGESKIDEKIQPILKRKSPEKDDILTKERPQLCEQNSSLGDVINELRKTNVRGFGPSVTTWSGSKSVLNSEVEKEMQQSSRLTSRDKHDEELDSGRTKKLKSHDDRKDSYNSNGLNPFQIIQNQRIKSCSLSSLGASSTSLDSSSLTASSTNESHRNNRSNGSFPNGFKNGDVRASYRPYNNNNKRFHRPKNNNYRSHWQHNGKSRNKGHYHHSKKYEHRHGRF